MEASKPMSGLWFVAMTERERSRSSSVAGRPAGASGSGDVLDPLEAVRRVRGGPAPLHAAPPQASSPAITRQYRSCSTAAARRCNDSGVSFGQTGTGRESMSGPWSYSAVT